MSDKQVVIDKEIRKKIQQNILILEKANYNQKEFSEKDMIKKIKQKIEEEVNK